jgi:hypothetical protein
MMAKEVFISYSRVDLPFVEHLDKFLTDLEVSTWFDQKSLRPGQIWAQVIEDEIPQARTFLLCLSRSAMEKRGYFHTEQHSASSAALRVPSDQLFIIPILLGDCELPKEFRQYHAVNLVEAGAIEMLLAALSSALERQLVANPQAVIELREQLIGHLGAEGVSNQDFVNRFMKTDEISFQDSMGIIERIASSSDPNRLGILLKLRAHDFLSYAEQAALDISINNVKAGRLTQGLQASIKADEWGRITQMGIPGDPEATFLLQFNKYARYVSRKGTQPYKMAEDKIRELVTGQN